MNTADTPFIECASRLRQLHGLIAAGKGDSAEADSIRDEMDEPWAQLQRVEIERLEGLSEDLYLYAADRKDREAARRFHALLLSALQRPVAREDWELLLGALRESEGLFPAPEVYYFKARAWDALGDPETALWFLEKSVEVGAGDPNIRYLYLTQLAKLRFEQALEQSRRISKAGDEFPPELLFKAGEILLLDAERQQRSDPEKYKVCVETFTKSLERAQRLKKPLPKSMVSGAFILLGLCRKRLGSAEQAERFYSESLKEDPENAAALVARGMLNYGIKTEQAVADFRHAVKLGEKLVWPYFFLAHYELGAKKYAEALSLCTEAARRTRDPDVLGNVMLWRAIAAFELNGNAHELRASLWHASSLAPRNPSIQANLQRAKSVVGAGAAGAWDLTDIEEVRHTAESRFELELA